VDYLNIIEYKRPLVKNRLRKYFFLISALKSGILFLTPILRYDHTYPHFVDNSVDKIRAMPQKPLNDGVFVWIT